MKISSFNSTDLKRQTNYKRLQFAAKIESRGTVREIDLKRPQDTLLLTTNIKEGDRLYLPEGEEEISFPDNLEISGLAFSTLINAVQKTEINSRPIIKLSANGLTVIDSPLSSFNVDFSGSSLQRLSAPCASLEGCSFMEADLSQGILDDANLKRTDLNYADLRGASFKRTNFTMAILHEALIEGAKFNGANLSMVAGHGMDFGDTPPSFNGATLHGTFLCAYDYPDSIDFRGASIGFLDFLQALQRRKNNFTHARLGPLNRLKYLLIKSIMPSPRA